MPGPLAKPPEDRQRRNKTGEDGLADEMFHLEGKVNIPEGVSFENPMVQRMWDALQESVNVMFYEPTDWAYAILCLTTWDSVLNDGKVPGAMLLVALDGMMANLLVTEKDRRKLRIHARRDREQRKDEVKASDFYKEQFAAQTQKRSLELVPDEPETK